MAYSAQDLSTFLPEVWSKEFITLFDTLTVMKKLVNTKFEGEIKKFGDTVHVRQFGDITTSTYTRNSTLSMAETTVSDNTMLIDQQKYQLFGVDDMDKAQSDVDIMQGFMGRSAVSMRNTVDSRLISHYADANASNVIGTTSAPEIMTKDNIYDYFIDMHTLLDNQNIEDQERFAVITPATRGLIRKSLEIRGRGSDMVDEAVRNGYAGDFAGWKINVTTNIATVSASKPHMFFTKDFISFAMQAENVEHFRPHDVASDVVRVTALYGSKVFTNHAKAGGVIHVAA